MGVEPKIWEFPPKSSILIGFSIINHPFWSTPIIHMFFFHSDVSHRIIILVDASLELVKPPRIRLTHTRNKKSWAVKHNSHKAHTHWSITWSNILSHLVFLVASMGPFPFPFQLFDEAEDPLFFPCPERAESRPCSISSSELGRFFEIPRFQRNLPILTLFFWELYEICPYFTLFLGSLFKLQDDVRVRLTVCDCSDREGDAGGRNLYTRYLQ